MSDQFEPRSTPFSDSLNLLPEREERHESALIPDALPETEPSSGDLFDLYDKVVKTRPGTRDAEIFEKIREWTFSDFTQSAYEFAGVDKAELDAWQKRHRINLSAGHIRPEAIDLQRGYAWGHIRHTATANRLHGAMVGPPSAEEVRLAWSQKH
jgi:hypothetical protein